MSTTAPTLAPLFINGEWSRPTGLSATPVFNPSTGETIAQTPVGGVAEAEAAVAAAHSAFPGVALAYAGFKGAITLARTA